MLRHLTPPDIHPPLARYDHGVEVLAEYRTVFVAGQMGIDASGRVPEDVEAQAALCFENILAVLAEVGMGASNLVRITAYVTGREHLAGYNRARERYVAEPPPASTTVIVAGLAQEKFLVEVEAVAGARD